MLGACVGATTMYFVDPKRGTRRRHGLHDRLRSTVSDIEDITGKAERDVRNRMYGLAARARGSQPTRRSRRTLLSDGTPERRLIQGGTGAVLALWGVLRGGVSGLGAVLSGVWLAASAAVPQSSGAISVQKTITIRAPIAEVFQFWSRIENFPRFMKHVVDVKSDGERSHWRVIGPANAPLEWDAEIVERIDNRKIAWRSIDSKIVHEGEVHFEDEGDGVTRISVHMMYKPPGGALGHLAAGFLLGDPKTLMDDDLLQLKSLLENGKTTTHSQTISAAELR
jgi:uncharacterized membrane protein